MKASNAMMSVNVTDRSTTSSLIRPVKCQVLCPPMADLASSVTRAVVLHQSIVAITEVKST